MHCFLVRTSATFSELVLGFSEDVGPVSEQQIELAQLLLPHLRRAVTVSSALDATSLLRTQLSRTLDALSCAIFLTNADCDVVYSNMAATALLKEQRTVAIRGKRLTVLHHAGSQRELRRAVRLCHGNAMQLQQLGIAIRLTDLPPFAFAHVLPLQLENFRDTLPARAVAAVFIRTGVLTHHDIDQIAAAFRLTAAEKLIASTLLAGHSLTDAASKLGIARTTAKTHLENIFQKSGVTRQADFIRLALLALPPN